MNTISPIDTTPGTCRSCGAQLKGSFCSECGEKEFVPGEHTIRHFFGDVLNAITFFDGKFLRSIKLMVTNPGLLSYMYNNGRRVPFMKPMSMFFIVNLIYFLFPVYDALNSSLYTQMNLLPHSAIATRMVEKRVAQEKTTLEKFKVRYEQQSTNMAKMWVVLLVLYFSVALWLVNYKKSLTYFDHLTASLELWSSAILGIFVLAGWLLVIILRIGALFDFELVEGTQENISSFLSVTIILILLYFFERNAYSQTIFRSLTKAALLLFLILVTLQLYRASLFFITFWTM